MLKRWESAKCFEDKKTPIQLRLPDRKVCNKGQNGCPIITCKLNPGYTQPKNLN